MQPPAMTSDQFDLAKFIKLMKMTTSPIDGEANAAIRMANAMLRKNGLDWEFLRTKITIVNDPFGSIPEPPAAKAAPPPRPAYQPPPPPPPQRRPRDNAMVTGWLTVTQANHNSLSHYEITRLAQVQVEWSQHQALTDADYAWLSHTVGTVTPRPRARDAVQQCFDTLELAPLSQGETQRYARVRQEWFSRGNHTMNDADYNWLENLHNRHRPRGARGGKAKRIF